MSDHPNVEHPSCVLTGLPVLDEKHFVQSEHGPITRFLWPADIRNEIANGIDDEEIIRLAHHLSLCPRCQHFYLLPDMVFNQTSQHDRRIFICNPCGREEALIKFMQKGVIPSQLSDELKDREQRMINLSIQMGLPPTKEEA